MAVESVAYQTLVAVRDTIAALNLEGVAGENVRWQKVPFEERQLEDLPDGVVLVSPGTEEIPPADGTNARDDVTYPVQVVYAQKSGEPHLTDRLNRMLTWRQSIRRAFHHQRLSGVSETGTDHIFCTVRPGVVILPASFQKRIDAGALVVRCEFRETR